MPAGGQADSPPRSAVCPSRRLQNCQCLHRRLRVHCGIAALWRQRRPRVRTRRRRAVMLTSMRNPNPPPLHHAAGPESTSTLWSSSPPLPVPHDNIGDCPFYDAVSVLTSSDRSLAPFPSPLRLPPTCAPLYRLFPFTQLLFLPPASLLGCCSVIASPLSLQQEQKPLHKSLTSPPITGPQLVTPAKISEPSSAAT
ncbi:hypothetical protein U9M48_017777 [Paspalum notatum var. saurae]|uniref:Uncharacterized protein n=1 Tax=Paspalum notatum var. saurae TaxID=547442 RepID=A0AAQ3TAC6_PASNO